MLLCSILGISALFVGVRNAAGLPTDSVAPETITVDGNPGD